MHLLQHTPGFSPEQALAIAREHYGLEGPLVSALPSERDQNFLLESRGGERFVLKIANALEDPGFLEAQHQVLGRLAGEGDFCPRVLASRSGAPLVTVTSPAGMGVCPSGLTSWLSRMKACPPCLPVIRQQRDGAHTGEPA